MQHLISLQKEIDMYENLVKATTPDGDFRRGLLVAVKHLRQKLDNEIDIADYKRNESFKNAREYSKFDESVRREAQKEAIELDQAFSKL